jgi:antitoxin ParD1/3/4
VNVSLTPEIEKIVAEKIASGEYPSASEVFRQALELLEERDRLIKLRRDVSLGVEQLDQGCSKRFDIRTLTRIRRAARKRLATRRTP